MKKETKNHLEYFNHNPNWLKTIIIEIEKFLINCEYINFFLQMFMQCIKDYSLKINHSAYASVLENDFFRTSGYILKLKQWLSLLCSVIAQRLFSFKMMKKGITIFLAHVKVPYWFSEEEWERCIWPIS